MSTLQKIERPPLAVIVLVPILLYAFIRLLSVGKRHKDYPPGPPTVPLLGNILQMPTQDAHLQFEKWAQEYGEIYSLMLGTQPMIVLNSDEAVKELLDRNSSTFSSRLEMYVGQVLCSDNLRLLMMGYTSKWRRIRKMVHHLLNANVAHRFEPYQMLESKQMLNDLLDTPDQFLGHIQRYSNALTTSMVFGWRAPTHQDKRVQQFFDDFAEFLVINTTGVAALLDAFPLLRRLPDALLPVQKKAKSLHKTERQLYLHHWLNAKREIEQGTAKHSFCVGMAEAQRKEGFSDAQAAYNSGTLFEAGSDTTTNTLYAFVQAMLLYPEVQRHAQQQLDEVVGEHRLPTMEDQANLPYIRMIMKEVLRWAPTAILGAVPHATTEAATYKGYRIPAGAGVINNVWAIHMNSKRFPNPRMFDPHRYEHDTLSLYDSATNPDVSKRDCFTFGAGRRICPGMHVAERSLFLGMARLLWALEIRPAKDAKGEDIIPVQHKFTQGFVCLPEKYPAKITPRSAERADIIRKEWEVAQAESLDPETKQWIATPF